jgi:NAD(P)-dependent dehydrogenase (short-subunit alcohol dehydrogenase family)
MGPTTKVDMADWAATIEISVIAPAHLTVTVLPGMLDQRWGRVVNVSSAATVLATALVGGNAYVAAKSGLEAHTVNLAAELTGTGVTVNIYRPGQVDTAMYEHTHAFFKENNPAVYESLEQTRQAGGVLTPERSAAALLAHLADDETGKIWHVDKTL